MMWLEHDPRRLVFAWETRSEMVQLACLAEPAPLAGQGVAVRVRRLDGIGDTVFSIGKQSRGLPVTIPFLWQRRGTAAVAYGRTLGYLLQYRSGKPNETTKTSSCIGFAPTHSS
jgi:hypothetical protein